MLYPESATTGFSTLILLKGTAFIPVSQTSEKRGRSIVGSQGSGLFAVLFCEFTLGDAAIHASPLHASVVVDAAPYASLKCFNTEVVDQPADCCWWPLAVDRIVACPA